MKRRTLWKIVAAFCMIAMLLPTFSTLTAIPVDATTNAPYPYAMEAYGQAHSGIYSTATAPALDGVRDATYTKMAELDEGSGVGTFVSSEADGSNTTSPASEYFPKFVSLYATYDTEKIYFFVESAARPMASYTLSTEIGFDFGPSQANAQNGVTNSFTLPENSETASGENFFVKTAFYDNYTDSTGTYSANMTSYEFSLSWANLRNGGVPGIDFDMLYFSASFEFDGGDPYYWFWGVPNSMPLPTGDSIGVALDKDGLERAIFTPNVIELLGAAPATYTKVPQISNVIRIDNYKDAARTFRASVNLAEASKNVVKAGVLYSQTGALGGKHLVKGVSSELICDSIFGTDATNYDATLEISKDNYNTFYSLRPYVEYSDGSVAYGPYYTISSLFFDSANKDYPRGKMSIMMIGCSFNYYHLNELVAIAAADGLHLTAANIYRSGAPAIETWTFLNYDDPCWQVFLRTPEKTYADQKGDLTTKDTRMTIKEGLALVEHWDMITVQDHYGITTSDTLEECVDKTMPYLPNVFRYLEINHPESRLYLHQTWAFQPGYHWGGSNPILDENGVPVLKKKDSSYNVQYQGSVLLDDEGNVLYEYDKSKTEWAGTGYYNPALTIPGDSSSSDQKYTPYSASNRMDTIDPQQTRDWENIKACTEYFCTSTGNMIVPSGSAWQLARHKTYTLSDGTSFKVGDILCNKGPNGSNSSGDKYHDGTTGGGQYLNACCLYEVLTGYDVTNVDWAPTADNFIDGYDLDPKRAEALRMAAHEAVAASRAAGLTDHYGK